MSSDQITRRIADLFPQGLETATGTKWRTVLDKLAAGDLVGAQKHLNNLARFIKLKMGSIELPAAERAGAATQLVFAMQTFVFNRCDLHPNLPECTTPPIGPDATFQVVDAGQAATVVTPSEHAGFHIASGSTNEERTFFVVENPEPQEKKCAGPLPTKRCQYKLFYRFESFPDLPLNIAGHFGVCMSFAPGQGPLDYTSGGQTQEVHGRMRLAHNKPDKPAKYVAGGVVEGDVEILPLTQHPTGFGQCTHAASAFRTHDGLLGVGERVLLAIANVVGKYVTPKNAYAYDQGFEHDALNFSDFNGLDAGNLFVTNASESGPDLSATITDAPAEGFGGDAVTVTYSIANTSRPNGGQATAASDATTASLYLFSDAGLNTQVGEALATATVAAMAPDDAVQVFTQSVTLPADIALNRDYWIAVRVESPSTGLADVYLANNTSAGAKILIKSRGPLPMNVLVFSNVSSDNQTVVSALTPLMPHVTFSSSTSASALTPSYLSQFKTVLMFENYLNSEGEAVGNALATYVQSGGNLVLGTFYWQNRSDNPRYSSNFGWGALETLDPLQAPPGMDAATFSSTYEYRSATLDASTMVTHPLTAGVTAVTVGFYPNGMAAKPGTSVVASYTNGAPFISYVTHSLGQRIVAVAAFPAHVAYGGISGDFYRVWTNAIDWSAGGSTPAPARMMASITEAPTTTPAPEQPKYGGTNGIRQ